MCRHTEENTQQIIMKSSIFILCCISAICKGQNLFVPKPLETAATVPVSTLPDLSDFCRLIVDVFKAILSFCNVLPPFIFSIPVSQTCKDVAGPIYEALDMFCPTAG